jgi:hypothetical protein
MSWTIAGKYVRASATDPDAQAYLQAVEAVDGQALEFEVARAIDNFVLGCKADGIWNAIKASCILAGARTRLGALTPLVGTAPTSFNFVDGDYDRKTGLVGNGSTKYLDSNRAGNTDPQNNMHLAVQISTIHGGISAAGAYAGNGGTGTGASNLFRGFTSGADTAHASRCRAATNLDVVGPNPPLTGLFGISRFSAGSCVVRTAAANTTYNQASQSSATGNYFVFARENGSGSPEVYSNARLAFYSIGESLDLALLDARVTDLINAFDTAIPS